MATRRYKTTEPDRQYPPPSEWPRWVFFAPPEADPRRGLLDPDAAEAARLAMEEWQARRDAWFAENRPDLAPGRGIGTAVRAEHRRRASH